MPNVVPSTPEERVNYIFELMARNEYESKSKTFRSEIAKRFGVSEMTIRKDAAEASRRMRQDPDYLELMRRECESRLDDIHEAAMSTPSAVTGLCDLSSAIKAVESKAKFAGIEFESKVRLSGGVKLESLDELRKAIRGEE